MAGSWVKADPWDKSDPEPQPRQGAWVKMDPLDIVLRVKSNGAFGWADVDIKEGGIFVPGEIKDVV